MRRRILLVFAGLWIVALLAISTIPVGAKTWPYVYYKASGKINEYNPNLPENSDRITTGSWRLKYQDGMPDFKANYVEENGEPEIEGKFDRIKLTFTDCYSIRIHGLTGYCETNGTLVAYEVDGDPSVPLFSIPETMIVITESEFRIYLPIPGFTGWWVRGSTQTLHVLFLLH